MSENAESGALDALERIAAGLVVNAERMTTNLHALQGLVFSERLARLLAREMDCQRAGARRRLVNAGREGSAMPPRRPARADRRDRRRVRTGDRGDGAGAGAGRSAGRDRYR